MRSQKLIVQGLPAEAASNTTAFSGWWPQRACTPIEVSAPPACPIFQFTAGTQGARYHAEGGLHSSVLQDRERNSIVTIAIS